MSLRISVLGSSSSGNCAFIATHRTRILLDAGFSTTQIRKRLAQLGESLDSIDALVISHEHSDHISGLQSLTAKCNLPVFITPATLDAIRPRIEGLKPVLMQAGEPFEVGDLKVSPFSVPHDAADPLGFHFEAEGLKIAHVTDLGYFTELVVQRLRGSHVLVLESNHDLDMLRAAPYPWFVKQRIMSRHGHLSNEMAGRFFDESFDGLAQYIVLAHLSENSNHPQIAQVVAATALEKRAFKLQNLWLASKSAPTPMIEM
ncbi:MAG: MBL fold metallo-hydrolase [Acidobacteriota bacterium]